MQQNFSGWLVTRCNLAWQLTITIVKPRWKTPGNCADECKKNSVISVPTY